MQQEEEDVLPQRQRRKRVRRGGGDDVPAGARNGNGPAAPPAAFIAPRRGEAVFIMPQRNEEVADDPSWKFEYLDHTADVQLHAWGLDLTEALEQVVVAMFHYITDLHAVDLVEGRTVRAGGHDMCSLLYNYMDECLYLFAGEDSFAVKTVELIAFDAEAFTIEARVRGERFDLRKHPQGTEVKAITYSAMQVHDAAPPEREFADIFVVVDI